MHILDLIFPRRCLNCGKTGKYFCDRCRLSIKLIPPNEAICPVCQKLSIDGATHLYCQTLYTPDGLTSFFRYDGIIKKAVKAIKYRYISDLAKEFISLIPQESFKQLQIIRHSREGRNPVLSPRWIPDQGDDKMILIPIPLHSSRFRERGFNQAEVLGKLLAGRLNIPIQTDALKRFKKTVPQVQMKDRKERLKNMEGVFALNKFPANKSELSIIIFDDVFTTGATMRSAANILKRAGIKKVWGMTMAR